MSYRKFAAAQRVIHGRKSVAPNLKKALKERNHALDSIFTVKTQTMNLKKDKETKEDRYEDRTGVNLNQSDLQVPYQHFNLGIL